MKRNYFKHILLCLCLLAGTNVYAAHLQDSGNSVSVDEAKKEAQNFLNNRPTFAPKRYHAPQQQSCLYLAHQVAMENGQNACYIFNNEAGGFVIVSGDNRAESILGYSDEGTFDADKMPENMRGWLEEYAAQIKYIQENELSASNIRRASHAAIDPMLTTTWDQGYPYNDECPDFFGRGKCLTGCGATAMAQLMYYHRAKSVTKTTATIPSYTTKTYGINVDAIPVGTPIDWDNMLDSYDRYSNDIQIKAVANLMKYCGVAVGMDYSIDCSDSDNDNISLALKTFFNYSYSMRWERRYNYSSDEEWDSLIYEELTNNRPVMYSGQRMDGVGHFFICDGYDGNGFYHINWGWGGYCDGYFLLSTLDPDKPYQNNPGVSSGYNIDQSALINASPRDVIPSGDGIVFADPKVKLLCLQNWDINDDGNFSMEEAAAVTDIGRVFYWQQSISSFDELQYFTGLTSIGDFAFSGCSGLTSVTIPNTVTSIGWGAFMFCSGLNSITIPESVTSIVGYVFVGCSSLNSIMVEEGNTVYDSRDNCNAIIETGSNTLISGCQNTIIPNSMTCIGNYALSGCSGLTSVIIPERVTSIGYGAFESCSSLTTISIGSGVTIIYSGAFKDCPELTDVYCYAEKAPQWTESDAFDGSHIEYATLHVPDAAVYRTVSPWSSFGTIVSMSVDDALVEQYNKLLADAVAALAEAKGTPTELISSVSQLSSPYTDPWEGSLANLLDGNISTFWHSTWRGGNVAGGLHYLQVELVNPDEAMQVYASFTRRQTSRDHVTNMSILGTNNPDAQKSACEELLTYDCPFASNTETIESPTFSTKGYRYLRFYANATTDNRGYWHISELQIYREPSGDSQIDLSLMEEDDILQAVINAQAGLSNYQITQEAYNELKEAYEAFMAEVATGIDTVQTNDTPTARYDLQGRRIGTPQKGINIIRMSDGTTRKVLVK